MMQKPKRRFKYEPGSSSAGKGFVDSDKLKTAMNQTHQESFKTSPLLETAADQMNLKYNHPFQKCLMPKHLKEQMPEVAPRKEFKKRQDVHSYFRPKLTDFVREMAKQEIRD